MSVSELTSKLKHGTHIMVVSLLAGANVTTILLMLATCLSTWISPAAFPRLSLAGLAFPVFLAINLCFIIAWLLVSWRGVWLPIVGMLLCGGYIWDYCPVNFEEKTDKGYLVLSFNVANYVSDSINNIDGNQSVEYIVASGADVICLQESAYGKHHTDLTKQLKARGYDVRGRSGMSIFSKWPFVGDIVYSTSQEYGNGSLACLINIDGDTTLVVNNHLQSNAISPQEKKDYISAISSINKDKMESSGRILLSRIAIAAEKRAEQTDTLCNLVERNQHRSIIVAGDMNDTPISYTYRRLTKHLKSAYRESGSGLGFSFVTKGFPVRIDHIFVSENLNTLFTYIDKEINSSDHLPILTRVSKSAK